MSAIYDDSSVLPHTQSEQSARPGSSASPPLLPTAESKLHIHSLQDDPIDVEDIADDHNSSHSSGSVRFTASSPPTDSEGDGDHHTKPRQGEDKDETDGTGSPSQCLRAALQQIDLIRLGRYPSWTSHCDRLDLSLSLTSYRWFRQFLEEEDAANSDGSRSVQRWKAWLDLDLDLEALRRWAQDRLIWDYDTQLALLMVRTNTPVHQLTNQELERLLQHRFRAALEAAGRQGQIKTLLNVGQIFKLPEPVPQAASASSQQHEHLPERSRSFRRRRPTIGQESTSATSTNTSQPASHESSDDAEASAGSTPKRNSPDVRKEDVRSPDVGLLFAPPGASEDYYPGFILEVGYSHPLSDSLAKRFIRYSNGTVRFVMAFNIEYDPAHQGRNISITTYRLVTTEDEWYPEKHVVDYDVRAQAQQLATDDNDPIEVDIGLRLSHLHELLLPDEAHQDVPIKLPLRELIKIVDDAFSRQDLHDAVGSGAAVSTPKSLRGKRARTETPPLETDDEALLRNPDSSYLPRSSAKRSKPSKIKAGN